MATARSLSFAFACCACLFAAPSDGAQWALIRSRIAKEFPSVQQLTTCDLTEWLADKRREKPVLLDVRAPEEFAVSHLPGARRVDPEATAAQLDLAKDTPIVTYCSVGYRSSALAERLRQAGYSRVQNLDGSIFQWANEDRPLVRDGGSATQVHPYGSLWNGMLKRAARTTDGEMTFSAPAKINLSLRVLRRRDDGFHEIESLMTPISLADEVEITRREEGGIDFACDDPSLPADDTNLVVRSAKVFCATHSRDPHLRIVLRKRIPHGAGLGGGSSDAATTLLALNEIFGTELPLDALSALAAQIGSDVPFFLHRGAAMVRGRGEIVTPCSFPHTLPLLLCKPPFGVPTPWAYQRWRDSREVPGVPYAPQRFAWGGLENDLERPVFEKHLFLALLKTWLLAQAEVAGALLSGSGATVLAVMHAPEFGDTLTERVRAEFGASMWIAACDTTAS